MQVILTFSNSEDMKLTLKDGVYTFGRSPRCDVIIVKEGMSRKHCKIEFSKGEIFVTDLGSTNGVSIDGQRLRPYIRTEYKTFLSLSFGAVQQLKVVAEASIDGTTSFTYAIPRPDLGVNSTQTKPFPAQHRQQNLVPNPVFMRVVKEEKILRWKIWTVNAMALVLFFAVCYWYGIREAPLVKYELTPTQIKKAPVKENIFD
ncbi:MAG TPA: FHA domain-containing protein [Bacteriovoracaceae bacterium]|nr:FHA domain-containing protein [Bacteriovoracaceae bacterium]